MRVQYICLDCSIKQIEHHPVEKIEGNLVSHRCSNCGKIGTWHGINKRTKGFLVVKDE